MTLVLIAVLVFCLVAVVVLAYLLGFRIGGDSWAEEAQRVRATAEMASRQMHDLTRAAFVAMAEETERRRRGGR